MLIQIVLTCHVSCTSRYLQAHEPRNLIEGKHHLCFLHDVSPLFCYWSTKSCTTLHTPPKTNMSPKRGPFQQEMIIFQPSIFRKHVSFRGSRFNQIPIGVGSLRLTVPTNLHESPKLRHMAPDVTTGATQDKRVEQGLPNFLPLQHAPKVQKII